MQNIFFSYSRGDGKAIVLEAAHALRTGEPPYPVFTDHDLPLGLHWDTQIPEVIRECGAFVFVVTKGSVQSVTCLDELDLAIRYKKHVIPLVAVQDAPALPFRLTRQNAVMCADDRTIGFDRLRKHLAWLDSPEGQLQLLKLQLLEAERDLALGNQRAADDIATLNATISSFTKNAQTLLDTTSDAFETALERERQPVSGPPGGVRQTRFINSPPLAVPRHFQNRTEETKQLCEHLNDDAIRVIHVAGRGGIGKTALTCRVLRGIENGKLPESGDNYRANGIVYFNCSDPVVRTVDNLFNGIVQLVPEDALSKLGLTYQPNSSTADWFAQLVAALPQEPTLVLLDGLEHAMDETTGELTDRPLREAIRAILLAPHHGLKLLITTRVVSAALWDVHPERQRRIDLENGLASPYAEQLLQKMDSDGKLGMQTASKDLLNKARLLTAGHPRALESLFGILSADRSATLTSVLDETRGVLPEKVVMALVGEAFGRLDPVAQRVMYALAVFNRPVPGGAVDYALKPYIGVDSTPILSRLVNMRFVELKGSNYVLHQIDRDYASEQIPKAPSSADAGSRYPLHRDALARRATRWHALTRRPRKDWSSLADLEPQLAEIELRLDTRDHEGALAVLLSIDTDYLLVWGHYRLVVQLHERLRGKIKDRTLQQRSLGNLGMAYHRVGDYKRMQDCFRQALELAQQERDRYAEGIWTCGLATCEAEQGYVGRAKEHLQKWFDVQKQVGDLSAEAAMLNMLGGLYSKEGVFERAVYCYERALHLDANVNDRASESIDRCGLAYALIQLGRSQDAKRELTLARQLGVGSRLVRAAARAHLGRMRLERGRTEQAIEYFNKAIVTGDKLPTPQIQQGARRDLAIAHLISNDYAAALTAASDACKLNYPIGACSALAVRGLAEFLLRQEQAARKTFKEAIRLVRTMQDRNSRLYEAFDCEALALCALTLLGETELLKLAEHAYSTARSITSAKGPVSEAVRLFTLLADSDSGHRLQGIAPFVSGEKTTIPAQK